MSEQKKCEEFIQKLECAAAPKDICKIRTQYCIEWYTKNAVKYKYIFLTLSIFNIALPQFSNVVVMGGGGAVFSAAMSSIVSVSAALLALLNVRERWTSYRSAAENIKREYTLYCSRTAPYQGDEAHLLYLQTLEKSMAEEHKRWIDLQKETSIQVEDKSEKR